jgi:hypothetical protein
MWKVHGALDAWEHIRCILTTAVDRVGDAKRAMDPQRT